MGISMRLLPLVTLFAANDQAGGSHSQIEVGAVQPRNLRGHDDLGVGLVHSRGRHPLEVVECAEPPWLLEEAL